MFRSATLKLTGWYLLILMTISILFSVALFQIATNEVSTRLTRLQTGIEIQPTFDSRRPIDSIRILEAAEASSHLIVGLLYANILVSLEPN